MSSFISKDQVEQEKEGFFEWIVSFQQIRPYFAQEYHGIPLLVQTSKILEIGCGTSTLSLSLVEEYPLCEVVSIDNDSKVVSHMLRESVRLGSSSTMHRMKWYKYDIIEDCGIPQDNELDQNGYFDLVVDKGTFDAIHVEGVTYKMLADIHRLLRIGGVYMLFSINSPELIQSLLGMPELNMQILFQQSVDHCTVVYARKQTDHSLDIESMAAREQSILNYYFQNDHPLLTDSLKSQLAIAFARVSNDSGGGYITLQDAHRIMFIEHNAQLGYTYDLFIEDIETNSSSNDVYYGGAEIIGSNSVSSSSNDHVLRLAYPGMICFDEAIAFLKAMQ